MENGASKDLLSRASAPRKGSDGAQNAFDLFQGDSPLLVSVPHCGTYLPDQYLRLYVERAQQVEDTDWHLGSLYSFAKDLGASLIVSTYARYLIDLNRPPENTPMYANANNTELVPTHFFNGDPLYRVDKAPSLEDIETRIKNYWAPYHAALQQELERIKQKFGYVILWDGHSIRSRIPWLFEGKLEDINLGTANGASCAPELSERVYQVLQSQQDYDYVLNGRFKGGYITRHYGKPEENCHAIQLEMCQYLYMAETYPFALEQESAGRVQKLLQKLLQACLAWKPNHSTPRGKQ